jgi:hypothetical protein
MEHTPTGFDAFFFMKKEWSTELESWAQLHSTSSLKDNDAKKRASPETTHDFN